LRERGLGACCLGLAEEVSNLLFGGPIKRVRPQSNERKREGLILPEIDQFGPQPCFSGTLGESSFVKTKIQTRRALKTPASDLSVGFHTAEIYMSPSRISSAPSYSGVQKFGAVIAA